MKLPLQGKEFNLVSRWLRKIDGDLRIAFFKKYFKHSSTYRLAVSTVNNRNEAYEILKFGFDSIPHANSQFTKLFVDFGIKKLGLKRTIIEVESRMDRQPYVVDMALYWLPRLIESTDSSKKLIQELSEKADKAGVIKPSRRSVLLDGRVVFKDRYGK